MKRSSYIILFLLGIFSQYSIAQTWQWSKQIGSIGLDYVKKVIADKNNNVYLAGGYDGPYCYFENDTVGCNGDNDFFVAKYNSVGAEQWVKRFGGNNSGSTEGCSIGYDSVNNYIYIAGSFIGTCIFDSITLHTAGGEDGFVAKYDVNGNCLWAKRCGGLGITIVADVGVDQNGDICIVGQSTDAITFDTITIATGVFLAKYDSGGNCLWAKKKFNRIPSPVWVYEIEPYSLQTFENDIFIGGACYVDTLSIDSILLTNAHKISMVLARFDSVGNAKWVITGGGPYTHANYSIAVDKLGYSYIIGGFGISGIFEDDTLYHPSSDIFLAEYNPGGQLVWARQCHDSSGAEGYSVCTDRNSGVYVTGTFSGTAYFGDYILSATAPADLFIAKYSPTGDCLGAINNGGGAGGYCISTDYNNDVVSAGWFSDTITFGSNPSMTPYGGMWDNDIYLVKSDAITETIEERRAENRLLIYANPTSGICNVTIPDEFRNEKNLTLRLFDYNGKLIQQGNVEMNEEKVRVNLQAEAKGIYNVTLSNGKKSYGGKIVFE